MTGVSDDSISELTHECRKQIATRRGDPRDAGPCYELFRRAMSQGRNDEAWRAIVICYRRLVLYWLGPYADEDTLQDVFLHFWRAQHGHPAWFADRFPNIGAVMGYLKQCAVTVRIEAERERNRHQMLRDRLRQAAVLTLFSEEDEYVESQYGHEDLKKIVVSCLQDEREYVVFEETYRYNLPPRDIQARHPDLFPTRQTVYRVKENLLKRLRRDERLKELWERC